MFKKKKEKKKRKEKQTGFKKGLVPKTGFDTPESFDLGRFSQTNFTAFFFWTNFDPEKKI